MTRLDRCKHRPLCFAHPNGGAGEIPAPTVTVWMGEESRDRFRCVPLLFNALELKGGICMPKYPYQGEVCGNTSQLVLTLLISSMEKELFQSIKIASNLANLIKKQGT